MHFLLKVSFERPIISLDLTVHHMVTAEEVITATIRKLMCDPACHDDYQRLLDEVESESYYDTSFESDDPTLATATNFYLLKINGKVERPQQWRLAFITTISTRQSRRTTSLTGTC